MRLRFSATGLARDAAAPPPAAVGFIDTILRGIGQVMLQNNSYAGIAFLAGVFWNSALFGCAVLVGTVVSTVTAIALGARTRLVQDGLFGFNGALVAIAVSYFLVPDALTWAYVVFAAASSTVLMAAMLRAFEAWKLPVLTAPFVFTALAFLLACARFGRLQSTHVLPTAGLPTLAGTVEGVVTGATVFEGVFNGIAQVFFQGSVVTGVLFALGLLASSRRAFAAAILGALAGLVVAWGLGAAEPAIRSGAFGFNSVLTAIALGTVFFAPGRATWCYAAVGTVATAIVFAAVSAALEPLGMPALTLPFVLVVWLFVLAGPVFPRVRAAG